MNSEKHAHNILDEVPHIVQPDKRLIVMAQAILVAIEALEQIRLSSGEGGSVWCGILAREALDKIRWEVKT